MKRLLSIASATFIFALALVGQVYDLSSRPFVNTIYANQGDNLFQKKQSASPGTTIVVGAGLYNAGVSNLLKNGVNWHFMPGAVISNSYTGDVGIFDDSYEGWGGAVTSIITGNLSIIDNGTYNIGTIYRGLITLTNPLTRVSLKMDKARTMLGGGGFIQVLDCAYFNWEIDEIDWKVGGFTILWEGGVEVHGRFNSIFAGGDSPIWVGSAKTADWFLDGNLIQSFNDDGTAGSASIYFLPTSPKNKLWMRVKEIRGASVAAGYGGTVTVAGGKLYLEYQKMSGIEDIVTPRALIEIQGGEAWITGQKMTVTNNQHFVWQSGGFLWLQNLHYEDAGKGSSKRPYNFRQTGGTNWIGEGRSLTRWGPFYKLEAGQTTWKNLTVDTLNQMSADGALTPTNACLWITGGTPIMQNCTLIPSCIFSITNSAASNIKLYGTTVAKSNKTATVTVQVGTLTVDTNVDR